MKQHSVATQTNVLVLLALFSVCSAPFRGSNEGPVWAAVCFEGTFEVLVGFFPLQRKRQSQNMRLPKLGFHLKRKREMDNEK